MILPLKKGVITNEIATTMTMLTKFDAAERQLLQAIRLFFREEDAISIHTLSEAASQILYDIGKEAGIKSVFRDSDRIREDKKKEFFSYLFKSRNFFKHADKDKDEAHEFKDEFNEFSLIDSVNLYSALKKKWTPETLVFDVWFCLHRPNLLISNTEYSNLISKIKSDRIFPSTNEKPQFYEVIEQLRSGKSTAQNLTLAFGL